MEHLSIQLVGSPCLNTLGRLKDTTIKESRTLSLVACNTVCNIYNRDLHVQCMSFKWSRTRTLHANNNGYV